MSTKIYYGFRKKMSSFEDMELIQNGLVEIREKMVSEARDLVKNARSWRTVCFLFRGEEDNFSKAFRKAKLEYEEKTKKYLKEDYSRMAFFKVHKGYMYFYLPFPQKYISMFEEKFEIEPFGYWDNTDPDEKATPEEWAERKRIWEEIIGIDSWIEAGFFFYDLVAESDFDHWGYGISREECLKSILENENRLKEKFIEEEILNSYKVAKLSEIHDKKVSYREFLENISEDSEFFENYMVLSGKYQAMLHSLEP